MNKPLLVMALLVASVPVAGQGDSGSAQSATVWKAREVSNELIETVINGNLFVPNMRREPRVELPPGEAASDIPAIEQEAVSQETYQADDPDRAYRLIGSSYTGGQWLAFIENSQTREIYRVAMGQTIASGTITTIDFDRIEYAVNDETRDILIGRDLTGADPSPSLESELNSLFAPVTTTGDTPIGITSDDTANTSATESTGAVDSRAEILRRLRERRERESQ